MSRQTRIGIGIALAAFVLLMGGLLVRLGEGRDPVLGTPSSSSAESANSQPSADLDTPDSSPADRAVTEVPDDIETNPPAPPVADRVFPERGSALTELDVMPSGVLTHIDSTRASARDAMRIEFIPYGYEPGSSGSAVVVRVLEVTPLQQTSREPLDLRGRDLLCDLGTGERDVVDRVAKYSGRLRFTAAGAYMTLSLEAVSVVEE